MMSKNSIVLFLKDYLIKFLTRPFLLDTNDKKYIICGNFYLLKVNFIPFIMFIYKHNK